MSADYRVAGRLLEQAARDEHDFAGWLAAALAYAAAGLGSSDALIAGRPGSWEASLVDQLVKGTTGYGDEYLPDRGVEDAEPAAGRAVTAAVPAGGAVLATPDLVTVLGALDDAVSWCQDNDYCDDCETSATGPCETHAERLARIPAYRSLARSLGDDR